VTEQRFFKLGLNELVDLDSLIVREYVAGKTLMEVAEAIIREVRYPLHLGQPDDKHIWNAFHGSYKWCKTVNLDFWQKSSETLAMKVGDCEDSSIAFTACARLYLDSGGVYEAFGLVRDANTGAVLGGHGWVLSKGLPDDVFRLYESTLDEPPLRYPEVPDVAKPFTLGNVIYEPEWLWNDQKFMVVGSLDYRERKKKEKETTEKYDALSDAWGVDTKPSKAMRKSLARKLLGWLRR
jgi:hypothetical protein